jgi:hypothetical protein
MSRRVAGHPDLPGLNLAAHRRRMMSQCQRRIVSRVTSCRSPWRRAFGITLSKVRQERPVRPIQLRALRLLPLQDGELVVQDQDLCGLPRLLTPGGP